MGPISRLPRALGSFLGSKRREGTLQNTPEHSAEILIECGNRVIALAAARGAGLVGLVFLKKSFRGEKVVFRKTSPGSPGSIWPRKNWTFH